MGIGSLNSENEEVMNDSESPLAKAFLKAHLTGASQSTCFLYHGRSEERPNKFIVTPVIFFKGNHSVKLEPPIVSLHDS